MSRSNFYQNIARLALDADPSALDMKGVALKTLKGEVSDATLKKIAALLDEDDAAESDTGTAQDAKPGSSFAERNPGAARVRVL